MYTIQNESGDFEAFHESLKLYFIILKQKGNPKTNNLLKSQRAWFYKKVVINVWAIYGDIENPGTTCSPFNINLNIEGS